MAPFGRRFLLRYFLGFSALGWGVCLAGVFTPAVTAFDLLAYVGGIDPAAVSADPMYDYWLRMAASVFAFVGAGYLGLAIWPEKYAVVLPFAGWFMVAEGIVLLAHGLRLGLPAYPLVGDTMFCFIGGVGILVCMRGVGEGDG